jgi:hypothetical protein
MKTITLSQNKVALVDDEDYDFLNQWKWCAIKYKNGNYYAVRHPEWDPITKKQITIHMHRLIMNAPDSLEVDHWDSNTLNNQKDNLRLATHSQNQSNRGKTKRNTSGYKGVSLCKKTNKWRALIKFNKKSIHLGYFNNIIDAARAYDQKAIELFGEFAKLNF